MFQITNIPKPDNLPTKRSADVKYPFGEMKSGDSFVVPFSEMKEGETSAQFRERVYKSAREYARKQNKKLGDDEQKLSFTAAVMEADDKNDPPRFAQGDVVVWRD